MSEQGLSIRLLSSMEKVLSWKEPSGDGAESELTGLKGENVSFQIAYYWESNRKSRGRISVKSGCANEGAALAENCSTAEDGCTVLAGGIRVRMRTVALSPCAYPCHAKHDDDYMDTRPGLYPDLLQNIRSQGFPLVAGQWRSLWIDLEIPEDADAGTYPLTFELEMQEDPQIRSFTSAGKIHVSCRVLDAVLPKLDIPHTEWFHCDCLANYYGVEVFSEEHWKIIEQFIRTAVKRGCNMLLTPVFTPPLDTQIGGERRTVQLVDVEVSEDGTYTFGFERFRRWVAMAQDCGMAYFEISHLFSQWGAKYAPKVMGVKKGTYRRLFGWETDAAGDEYRGFLQAFLDALIKEIRELGIAQQCFFHISDEPSEEQLDSYCAAKEIVAERLKDFRLIDALSSYAFYEKGAVDEPICGSDHIEPFLENRPKKLWTYYCTAQCVDVSNRFIVLPGYRQRILGAQLYKYEIDGFLQWGYNFYNSEYSLYPVDPYNCTDSDGAFPSGDPFLVYPGPDGVPEESIRLMLMDEVFADLRAMKLLETLTDRETVLACLEEKKFGEVTFRHYPRSAAYVAQMRRNVNEGIREALVRNGK